MSSICFFSYKPFGLGALASFLVYFCMPTKDCAYKIVSLMRFTADVVFVFLVDNCVSGDLLHTSPTSYAPSSFVFSRACAADIYGEVFVSIPTITCIIGKFVVVSCWVKVSCLVVYVFLALKNNWTEQPNDKCDLRSGIDWPHEWCVLCRLHIINTALHARLPVSIFDHTLGNDQHSGKKKKSKRRRRGKLIAWSMPLWLDIVDWLFCCVMSLYIIKYRVRTTTTTTDNSSPRRYVLVLLYCARRDEVMISWVQRWVDQYKNEKEERRRRRRRIRNRRKSTS